MTDGTTTDTDTDRSGRVRTTARTVWSYITRFATSLSDAPGRGLSLVERLVLGSPATYTTRVGTLIMTLSAVVVAMGVWGVFVSGLETQSSSSWFMSAVIGRLTQLWTYVAVGAIAVVALRLFKGRRAARLAAAKSGFSQETVRRLAAEAKTTDGCTTIIVSPSNSVREIVNQVLHVFDIPPIKSDNSHLETADGLTTAKGDTSPQDETALVPDPTANADAGESPFRITRLELASSLSFTELLWRFVMPAVATFVTLLVLARIWVAPWVYLVFLAASLLVGAAYYQYTRWRRRRQLHSLREPGEGTQWSDIAIMAKRVQTPDTTAYYAWVAGNCYVDYNAIRLATTVARAAYAHVHDETVQPAIQQKFARNVRQHVPNLRGYEENVEKPEIMDALADEVASVDGDILPKNQLADRVIERDKDSVAGIGYDPRLIAECYNKLVPYALVEEPVTVATPTDDAKEMTAVRLRTSDTPAEKAAAEAEFSTEFDPDADATFQLPDADHSHSMVADS